MLEPPIPEDEANRLALLKACKIIYTPAEEAFDDIARLAADLCGTEIALITLVDSDYQWFKARVGIEQTGLPRDLSFCGHCINHRHPLVVPDTLLDPRFADNPLVTADPKLRFYAGVPLLIGEGSSIGALSVADRAPRELTPKQLSALERLALQIARELGLRRDLDRVQAKLASSEFPVVPGGRVGGRWEITRELGRGAVGVVFEARDDDGERAALKVLLPKWSTDEHVLERFAREARVLMSLKTPHVGKLLDVGNLDAAQSALPYLALEYLEGTDLERRLASSGPVDYRTAFAWCADACDALAEAHDLGIVHRDLKPSNLFLAEGPSAPAPTVKVLDFGIAAGVPSDRPSKLTAMETVVGTPVYMAPEQMMSSSDVDPRSDVWSMGTLLYELMTGELPYRGDSELQLFANVLTKPPRPIRAHLKADAPPEVEALVMKCLNRQRDERFPSMTALAAALRSAIA